MLPESFKLPEITLPTVSGSVCSFNSNYAGLPLTACSVAIDYDANGITEVNITANGTTTTIPFGSTIYGGSYDAITGILTSDKAADGSDITPVETQIATCPIFSVEGANSVSADTGDTELSYIKAE